MILRDEKFGSLGAKPIKLAHYLLKKKNRKFIETRKQLTKHIILDTKIIID